MSSAIGRQQWYLKMFPGACTAPTRQRIRGYRVFTAVMP